MINKGDKKNYRRRERRKRNKIDIFTVYYREGKTGKIKSCQALIEKGDEQEFIDWQEKELIKQEIQARKENKRRNIYINLTGKEKERGTKDYLRRNKIK